MRDAPRRPGTWDATPPRADAPGTGHLLIVGIGNVLLRDEGVGVHVAQALAGEGRLPPGTQVVDGGTLGLDLLPRIQDAGALILVDAVNLRTHPGDLRTLHGDAIHGVLAGHVSPHQVGIGDLVAAARLLGRLPADVTLVGIQPAVIEVGLDLSDAVAAAVPVAVQTVYDEAWRAAAALEEAVAASA